MHLRPGTLSVIPLPLKIEESAGEFVISPETAIAVDVGNQRNAAYLQDLLAPPTGFMLPLRASEPEQVGVIRLRTGGSPEALGREGYTLMVSPDAIIIEAPEAAGVFYGI